MSRQKILFWRMRSGWTAYRMEKSPAVSGLSIITPMGESVGTLDMISAAIGGLFLFALYTVFQIPGYYKYGAIKGRVFMYIPVAGFLATLFFLPKMPADNPIVTTVVSSPVLLIGLVLVLIVVMYAVSIWLSIRIMENKEM